MTAVGIGPATRGGRSRHRRLGPRGTARAIAGGGLALAFAAGLGSPGVVRATNVEDFTVVPATDGGSIDPESAGRAWTTLSGPTIDIAVYSNPDVFPAGLSFTLTLPLGFEWDAGVTGAPTTSVVPGMPAGFCSLTTSPLQYGTAASAAGQATFSLSGTHDVGCRVALTGLRVRPVSGVRADAGGQIAVVWTVPGVGVGRASGGRIALAPVKGGGGPSMGGSSLPPTDTSRTLTGSDGIRPRGPSEAIALLAALVGLLVGGSAFARRGSSRRRRAS